jgi:peptidyl-prolyl cis-trans isomerase B (cyclophilin B)
VIKNFMIQGGDPESRGAAPDIMLGAGGPGYLIDAEIGSPHFKGTLAAARTGGPSNPTKQSSGSQFYIVQGNPLGDAQLNQFELMKGIKYSPAQRQLYKELGGRPDLDQEYTVFGEVVEGLDVIDKIAAVPVGRANRPTEDVKMKIRVY